jgi:hypothetical protein
MDTIPSRFDLVGEAGWGIVAQYPLTVGDATVPLVPPHITTDAADAFVRGWYVRNTSGQTVHLGRYPGDSERALFATGATDPTSANGPYEVIGEHEGEEVYRSPAGFLLFWDGTDTWLVQDVSDPADFDGDDAHWSRTDANPVGDYTGQEGATGTLAMAVATNAAHGGIVANDGTNWSMSIIPGSIDRWYATGTNASAALQVTLFG